jgi:hypothetical protein
MHPVTARHLPASGAVAFYGVRPAWLHLWHEATQARREWWYLDNSYFDVAREKQIRVTRNALQYVSTPARPSDGRRLAKLGIQVPERPAGEHIVICPQSAEFMKTLAAWPCDWLESVIDELRNRTQRTLRVRLKADRTPLAHDLQGAWALVTHSSAAAVEAVAAGIPAYCTGYMALGAIAQARLEAIDHARAPRRDLAQARLAILADHQWTLDEIARGVIWKGAHG